MNTTADPGTNVNCSQLEANCTLRAAINAANANPGDDGIVFDLPANDHIIALASPLPDISTNISFIGPGAGFCIVARAATAPEFQLMRVTSTGTVSFSGMSFEAGRNHQSNSVGGAIENRSTGTVNITECGFGNNQGDEGGAIGNFTTGTMNITNCAFSNNQAPIFNGGAISNVRGTMIIKNCDFSGNRARHSSGAIENGIGTLSVTDSVFVNNGAAGPTNPDGGGVIENRGGLLIIVNSQVFNSDSRLGGAILTSNSGTSNITGCTFEGNKATEGGAIMAFGGSTTNITNSTINANHALSFAGGGVQNNDGTMNLTNSTIYDNFSDSSGGGGIENNTSGSINISNCTVANNHAKTKNDGHQGAGVENFGTGTVTVKSSLIAANNDTTSTSTAQDVFGTFVSQGFNLIGKKDGSSGFAAVTDQTGTNVSPLDPKLDSLGLRDNGGPTKTIGFLCGSPAIDKGSRIGLNGPLTSDQRGNFARVFDDLSTVNASGGDGTDVGAYELQLSCAQASFFQFSNASYSGGENAGFTNVTVARSGNTSGTVSIDYATNDNTANQRTDYTIAAGTLTFAPGETAKTFPVLIVDDAYVEGLESLKLSLSNPVGGLIITADNADFSIVDNDSTQPVVNPIDDARFFVQQHFYDFLSRFPDQGGWDFWTSQITQCGLGATCLRNKRIDVSNAFFYELEYQQTGAYVFRLYRAAFGNHQPHSNSDFTNPTEAMKLPAYQAFAPDRARVVGGTSLAVGQLALARAFVLRTEFFAKYSNNLDGPAFVDAILNNIRNDTGIDLGSQRTALINLYNQNGGGSTGRGAVLYRLADDNAQTNPINNRAFIDEEYNRGFVATQYFGYLRRDADIGGFLFWLSQVNSAPLRDTSKQHAMVCAFITAAEYQQRFSTIVTHSNAECP